MIRASSKPKSPKSLHQPEPQDPCQESCRLASPPQSPSSSLGCGGFFESVFMQSIEIARIVVLPDRQRREFAPEKLIALQSSIAKIGLQHPIVVRRPHNGENFYAEMWIL